MRILFVSTTCSIKKHEQIFNECIVKKLTPSQKFYNLLIEGIINNQNIKIDNVVAIPVASSTHPKSIWRYNKENVNQNLTYAYLGFYNGRILKYITLFYSGLKECYRWVRKNKNVTDKIIICDPLVPTVAFAARLIGNLFGIKVIAFILDIPSLVTSIHPQRKNLRDKIWRLLYDVFVTKELQRYDAYILITESMNQLVNKEYKNPFLVIEGSVDIKMKEIKERKNKSKNTNRRTIIYAGGINEKFGMATLVRAFAELKLDNVVLKIFGSGDYVNQIKDIEKSNPNIRYMGIVTTDEIVKEEIEADLLVNPRPINEEFTKYSFPSKTLEYMSSGTATISTRLEGIPNEYEDYLYWFENDDQEAIAEKIFEVLNKPDDERNEKGLLAKQFVLSKKNNIIQGEKIAEFLSKLLIGSA
jgi:glycosyltransferase involved in cell wall biosynthesis